MGERRRLLLAYAAMAALTLAAIPIGHARDARPLAAALIVAVLGLSFLKAAILLNEYLELRHAPGWNRALRASILTLIAIVGALSLMARTG